MRDREILAGLDHVVKHDDTTRVEVLQDYISKLTDVEKDILYDILFTPPKCDGEQSVTVGVV